MSGIFRSLETLETERLVLRPVMKTDVKEIFCLMSDEDISRYTTWNTHRNIEESRQMIEFILKRYRENKPSNWAVVMKGTGEFAGTCGFVSSFMANKRAETAFAVRKDLRGGGIATEALKRSIRFGFEKMGLNRIEACCDTENLASIRVLEKSGMKFEGVLRQYALVNGAFRDMNSYSILACDASQEAWK